MKFSVPITGLLLTTTIIISSCKKSSPTPTPIVGSTASGKISLTNTSTFAGSDTIGAKNGTGTAASFYFPTGVAVDDSGNVYVADSQNNLIRKITPAGIVTTLAGSGNTGNTNASGLAASFSLPSGVAVDKSGTIYVADYGNNLIRKITPAGVVSTLAGSGSFGSKNAKGTAASFSAPSGVTVDDSGNVYVADTNNNLIRKITSAGVVTTLAGSSKPGSINGKGTAASFYNPIGITVDTYGNVYVTDNYNNMIRKITNSGIVTTLAGSLTPGAINAMDTLASFTNPKGITVDIAGNIYIADSGNNIIRKITSNGLVSTLAGSINGGNQNGTLATFFNPQGISIDAAGNLYIADTNNNMIRKITN